jgi:hypothetical protein
LRKSNRDFAIKVHNPDDHHPEAAPEAKTLPVDENNPIETHQSPLDQPLATPEPEKLTTRKLKHPVECAFTIFLVPDELMYFVFFGSRSEDR